MKILHVIPNYYPATTWGGPIFSTKAICDGIAAQPGVTLRVLTTDAASPARGDRVAPADLPYPVHYARRIAGHSTAPGLLAQLPGAIAWADVVHLTATYNFPTLPTLTLARALGRPVVWSPRGALQATAEWAEAPRRSAKYAFERAAGLLRPADTVLHVTAQSEAAASTTRLPGIAAAIIPNCVTIPPAVQRAKSNARIRLLYLGRLHPKKGLERLFTAMAGLPAHVSLDVYGTGDPAYTGGLQQMAACFDGRIRLHGHVDGAAKSMAFAGADLCVLPSYSENFGIAVAEALAHGVPVLTTTGTPWQGLEQQGCGRWLDLDQTSLSDEIAALIKADLPAMGARGRAWMIRDFSPEAMTAAFMDLYRSLTDTPHLMVPA